MIYTLYYSDYSFDIEQNYKDILDYEYEKVFNEEIGFFLTPEQKSFIQIFDSKWNKNEICESDYYTTRNYDFLKWLKDKYADEAEEANLEDMDADEWWGSLDYDTKESIMEQYYGY